MIRIILGYTISVSRYKNSKYTILRHIMLYNLFSAPYGYIYVTEYLFDFIEFIAYNVSFIHYILVWSLRSKHVNMQLN